MGDQQPIFYSAMFSEFLTLNLWWFVALVAVLNLLLFSFLQSSVRGATAVSVLEMPGLQRNGKHVIYDLNSAKQYNTAHIAGAVHLDKKDINANNKSLLKHKDHTVVLVCQSGSESIKAAKTLVGMGFSKVHTLRGGLLAWQKENLPLVASKS